MIFQTISFSIFLAIMIWMLSELPGYIKSECKCKRECCQDKKEWDKEAWEACKLKNNL